MNPQTDLQRVAVPGICGCVLLRSTDICGSGGLCLLRDKVSCKPGWPCITVPLYSTDPECRDCRLVPAHPDVCVCGGGGTDARGSRGFLCAHRAMAGILVGSRK